MTITNEPKPQNEDILIAKYQNIYSLVDVSKINAIHLKWPQDDIRDTWKLILKPFFPTEISKSPNGKTFRMEYIQQEWEFPQIMITNAQGPWESLPLFNIYCIRWPNPDEEMWKSLEEKAKWDLLTTAQSFDANPRPCISIALAVGPLVRFYKFDHELDYCHIDYGKNESLNVHDDFDLIAKELREIRQDMTKIGLEGSFPSLAVCCEH